MSKSSFILIVCVICSCEQKLDRSVLADYGELDFTLDWCFTSVVIRGYENVSAQVSDRGLIPHEQEMQDEIAESIADYNYLIRQIEECEERDLFEDHPDEMLVGLNDSLVNITIPEVNQWLEQVDSDMKFDLPISLTDWLYLKLYFKKEALNVLTEQINEVYHKLQPAKVIYRYESDIEMMDYHNPFEKIMVDGVLTDTDSTGVFEIDSKRPVTIKWPFEISGFREIKEMEHTVQ